MEDDPLFRRIRQHAELRLTFRASQSGKDRLEQIKEFMRLGEGNASIAITKKETLVCALPGPVR